MDEVDFYLKDLASRFPKDTENYYLSYSGGKDSHFLLWFIKEYLKDDKIKIVSVNTYMEHPEIFARMKKYADVILLPKLKPFEIKEKYGSPCFSKAQDDVIYYIQKGSKSESRLRRFYATDTSMHNVSKKAREYVLSGKAHKISPLCCKYLKKIPLTEFGKETGKHPILGVKGGESKQRHRSYRSCFTKDGKFTPLWDLTDSMLDKIYKKYNIEIPNIYNYVSRTGCMGCPYGSWKKETKTELDLLPDNKRAFVINYFRESYDVLGIDYKHKQENLFSNKKDEKSL